jgi:sarcosine oxidase subunit alpha
MGPSQGRVSQLPSIRAVADQTGLSIDETGITTARPPWSTVPLGAWAGRPFTPAKRSAIHARQRELGSHVKWAGDWRRAYDYGDVRGEAAAVHGAVGMIDVSTLGKMIVSGPDAGQFLDRMYTNRLSDLKVGRIRYGVLGNDAGRITDDGTVCRVADDSFLVTTTSSGADAVERWFTWWLAAWEMEVHVTDVTQGLCAINVAGPKARDLLGKLTDADLSNEGFGYLDGHQIQIAGVQCLAMRIGFVGELGYEIHYPAACGQYLWDQILDAGAEYGIKPFGLEPQRILRLEKAHIIVGQDTDSESNAYESQMGWIVKLDKEEDFMGKWALERANERGMVNTLVGFKIDGDDVPIEGSAVVVDGQPAGRVTSARYSELLGQSIGLAWVPAEHGKDGGSLHIKYGTKNQTATIVHGAFYDPDQERLRS